jgi:hypothetical protein
MRVAVLGEREALTKSSFRISADFAMARERGCVRSLRVAAGTVFWRVFLAEAVLEDGIV